ncbi:hypothetical protein [Pseudomaricurvus alkylphenolicus]|uniref:hypothetical protein n=1 Tax=Pseudomaricurvus alkylphenolicus TaxID=1306991 RepID=UPI001F0EFF7B|nr:hypothetical protein [Pseudomaricurvus alkylphenolicus]
MYVCDIHEKYIGKAPNVARLNGIITLVFVVLALSLVPIYSGAVSIINLLQQLNGLLSMPILSAFIVGLLFRNVDARAAIAAVVIGVSLYGIFTFVWTPAHYIHLMFVTLVVCIASALLINRWVYGEREQWEWGMLSAKPASGDC